MRVNEHKILNKAVYLRCGVGRGYFVCLCQIFELYFLLRKNGEEYHKLLYLYLHTLTPLNMCLKLLANRKDPDQTAPMIFIWCLTPLSTLHIETIERDVKHQMTYVIGADPDQNAQGLYYLPFH